MADATNTPPVPAAAGSEDFGQYLAAHQADLAPFFTKYADEFFRLAVPVLMGLTGWIVLVTMLVGWGIDILMSRGYAFFFAPAFANIKRSVVYATGRLALSFIYTCLLGLAIVFSLKFSYAGIVMAVAVGLLLFVALAAQIVWILYLYRTDFSISVAFYVAIIIVHAIVGVSLAKPLIGLRASTVVTDFVDGVITPRLRAEADATKHERIAEETGRNSSSEKVTDLQNQIAQSLAEQDRVRKAIEDKKNSDIYVFGRIVLVRAQGDLNGAHDQLTAFLAKFPTSVVAGQARTQLTQINNELAAQAVQKAQQAADAARAAAQARADLLARAAKGEVTLSEMRQALIGKTRDQVSNLLGLPSETASDSWGYHQRMILNPLTNQRFGLIVYFTEGAVQGVDYGWTGGTQ